MSRLGTICVGVIGVLFASSSAARAGVYHVDTIAAFDLDERGYAKSLSLDAFLTIINGMKKLDNLESPEAKKLLDDIQNREKRGIASLKPEELVVLIADMLRLRNDAAVQTRLINELPRLANSPPEGFDFLIKAQLAHAHFVRSEYSAARRKLEDALNEMKSKDPQENLRIPANFLGLSAGQRRWYQRLESDYLLPLYENRYRESELGKSSKDEQPDPIFDRLSTGKRTTPVRFVGESGKFEPGTIAAAEKVKLPPDAIAIVQQLILWFPGDGRLWWLLAELYNAEGNLEAAERVFALCALEVNYTNRELRNHRQIVFPAYEKQREELAQLKTEQERIAIARKVQIEDEEKQKKIEERKRTGMVVAGVVVVLFAVIYWQTREIMRRFRKRQASVVHPSAPHE
ncbi:MAG: hypothetical protein K8T89_08030 [Planctomycetes bacterium]|nr:hypothetical protein [Planctomycetota bacterium]